MKHIVKLLLETLSARENLRYISILIYFSHKRMHYDGMYELFIGLFLYSPLNKDQSNFFKIFKLELKSW